MPVFLKQIVKIMSREKLASDLDVRQLIYCSHAVHSENKLEFEHDMHDILDHSRTYNRLHDITGALLTDGDMFFHVIEGVPAALGTLFSKVMRDSRHDGIVVLQHTVVHVRLFDPWPLAFLRISTALHARALHAHSTPLELRTVTVSILKAFRPMFFE